MTRPGDLPQVAEALKDLGWTRADPIFGHTTDIHCLQSGTPANEFVLAPKKVGEEPCSFQNTTAASAGFEFQEFLGNLKI
jgi:hypothetical protein